MKRLTPTELRIVNHVANAIGSEGELAERMQMSFSTFRTHLGTIYGKMGIHSRTELVIWVWRLGEIEVAPDGRRRVEMRRDG